MNKKMLFLHFVTYLLTFSMIIGCGSNNSQSIVSEGGAASSAVAEGEVVPTTLVVLNSENLKLTTNNEVIPLSIRVYDNNGNPFNGGNVKITYLNDVTSGDDLGSFSVLEIPCINGEAEVQYTAPMNLEKSKSQSPISFRFYHESNINAAKTISMAVEPEKGALVFVNYELIMSTSDANATVMNLESSKTFTIKVKDEDGNELSENATYIIENQNSNLAKLQDTKGSAINPMTITGINASVVITTNTKSGTLPLKVTATFKDANGDDKTLERTFNVIVFSGPATAMSISYAGVDQDAAHANYIEMFSVKLTDKYDNPVNTQPYIHVGAIAGYAKDASISQYDDYGLSGLFNGNLFAAREDMRIESYGENQAKAILKSGYNLANLQKGSNSNNGDLSNYTLVTFGNGYTYHKSGKWDIKQVLSNTEILLDDEYSEVDSSAYELGFAIGNNHRQDTCEFGQEWVLTTESDDGKYQVDTDGYARIRMPYDYYLTGKDVVVYANLLGELKGEEVTTRVGEAIRHTLRGKGLKAVPTDGYVIPAGALNAHYIFWFNLIDTPEELQNATPAHITEVVVGEGVKCLFIDQTDYRYCGLGRNKKSINLGGDGESRVRFDCNNTSTKPGTITLKDTVVTREFLY